MSGAMLVRCVFYLRTPSAGVIPDYEILHLPVPPGMFGYPTAYPPQVGDIVGLPSGTYKVVSRQWDLPQYGSRTWPGGQAAPDYLSLTVFVETVPGVFADEAVSE